ncbi:LemA family protein [Desulfogranum mediterraneum]|uniref:LemA family protein n=1 Tax=Desulfogranum mediterraneum TaxID=160661 RepID=UPI0004106580|nr:LemA family protein [Desulfogranum mediterraneum]
MYRTPSLSMIILCILLGLGGCGYNELQVREEGVFKAWADIEANLQRRSDLIPNLVATVKGYAAHEQATLEAVVAARSRASSLQLGPEELSSPAAMEALQAAQGGLTAALSRLMVVVERYPQLKASANFLDLQNQLEGTENRINVARQRYNRAVEIFNSGLRRFPANLTNRYLLQLERKEYFQATPQAGPLPQVNFNGA